MKLVRYILLALGIIFVAIQFIRSERNKNEKPSPTDIAKVFTVPDSVKVILKNACYDCHSNNTSYPWYSHVQPFGWFLTKHITRGKDELNFSEFGSYSTRRQLSKLDEIEDVMNDDIMPLPSYRLLHKKARLSQKEKTLLINWAGNLIDAGGIQVQ
jgi:hypothetical protein